MTIVAMAWLLSFSVPVVSASTEGELRDECPMLVREIVVDGAAVIHNYFDKARGEQIARFGNGDVLVVRFNEECDLGFEASIFLKCGLDSADERRKIAAWLINLFKNDKQHDKRIRDVLSQESVFSQREFQVMVPGFRLDEKHALRLVDIKVSPDLTTSMFSSVMGYSWVPPSGE